MATHKRLAQVVLIRAMLVLTILLAVVWMPGSVAQGAATLTVTTTGDTVSCGTPCSLRGAIAVAGSGDTIDIPAGTYTLTLDAELNINKTLTINGAGSGDTIIQGAIFSADATSRVFNIMVSGDNVTISWVTIRHGKVSGGSQADFGGGIHNGGTLVLNNSSISGNSAGFGGGIYNGRTLVLTNSTISGNSASSYGGGIWNNSAGSLNVTESVITDNSAGSGGGLRNDGTLSLANSTITGNSASNGGGIYNPGIITLINTTVRDNTGGYGGGIHNGGTLTLTNSTITGNSANSGLAGRGGGIVNSSNGTVRLTNSTVSANTATELGGGIWDNGGTVSLTNTTISGNTATEAGGGIHNSGSLTLSNSTITGNLVETGRSGGIRKDSGTTKLLNTIIAGNTAPTAPDCSGIPTSLGHNLIGNDTGCGFALVTGDLVNVGPLLSPLQDNGGSTLTHALLPGSPAIDAGDDSVLGPPHNLTTDQRGIPRLVGAHVDIGAYEAEPVLPDFVVNSMGDGGDISPGDSVCQTVTGNCTLRAAIMEANSLAGVDTIAFSIPGAGPHTIQPTLDLPKITDPVIIDGYTQTGATPNTNPMTTGSNAVLKIELDGTKVVSGGQSGLLILAGSSTVRGLAINRFASMGIMDFENGGNTIEGNFIGTDVTGTISRGNGQSGVWVSTSNNTIGGTTPAARNVISGNNVRGVMIVETGNIVQGNFIGTDVTGAFDLGNSNSGVFISATSGNIIGGTVAGARNLISGNDNAGVSLTNGSTGNTVQGNFIGTDVTGTLAVGNRYDGVEVENAPNNLIGGTTAGAGNVLSGNHSGIYIGGNGATGNLVQGNFIGTDFSGTAALANVGDGIELRFTSGNSIGGAADGAANTIAFNGGDGVAVFSGVDNAILPNSLFSKVGLGIDLIPNGVTPNDAGDGDTGANNLQNFPVLTSATSGSTTVVGTLNSKANTQFRIEFYSNSACDPSGYGEGETFLGSTDVNTDGNGNASFVFNSSASVPVGYFITATATDPNNNTSEFSQCMQVLPNTPRWPMLRQ